MITTIIEYVVSPVLVALLGYIVWLLQQQKKAQSAQEKGLMLLLRREIIEAHYRYCTLGEPMNALIYDTLVETHNAYKALGGNGMTERLFTDIKNCEISTGDADV